MTLEIFIDHRETKLKQYFSGKDSIQFVNLELGDILINYNQELFLIIERKTLDDLSASIKDGRYKQQKLRLFNHYPKHKIMYIIEGNMNQSNNTLISGLSIYTLFSSIINCLLRDNLFVYKTLNIQETIQFIENMIIKLQKQGISFTLTKSNQDLKNEFQHSMIQKKKKHNITPELCFIGQLCQIPGISMKKATKIAEIYPNMNAIFKKLSLLAKTEQITELSKIQLSQKQNKKGKTVVRTLGKKSAEVIIQFLALS